MKTLGVLIPSYSGRVCWQTMLRIRQEEVALANAGWQVEPIIAGSSAIHIVRNDLVAQALVRGCDAVAFIDDDMDWDICGITRLLAHNVPIIGAPVALKDVPITWNVGWLDKDIKTAVIDERGLIEVSHVGTGIMVVRREVFYTLQETLGPTHKYLHKHDGRECWAYFEAPLAWGEDARFCDHCKRAGFKIYVDPYVTTTHIIAPNWSMKAQLAGWLEEMNPLNQAVEALKLKPSPEAFKAIWDAWGNSIWSATPDMLAACYDLARQAKGPIVEMGSGLSTFVMALANPNVVIHCVEHDPAWAKKLHDLLVKWSLDRNVHIHKTEIIAHEGGPFYDLSSLPETPFGMAVLDGPPHVLGNRNVAYKLLGDRIEGATLVVDDTNNPHVQGGLEEYTAGKEGETAVYENEIKRWSIFIPGEAVQKAA